MSCEIETSVIGRLNFTIDEANREEDLGKLKAHVIAVYDVLVSNREQLNNGNIRKHRRLLV